MRMSKSNDSVVGTRAATDYVEMSRVAIAAGTKGGDGFWRTGTMRIVAALALVLSMSPALAEPMRAGGEPAVRSSAALDFRIVIPETLHIDSRPERRKKSQEFISRTLQSQDGRQVLTVARP